VSLAIFVDNRPIAVYPGGAPGETYGDAARRILAAPPHSYPDADLLNDEDAMTALIQISVVGLEQPTDSANIDWGVVDQDSGKTYVAVFNDDAWLHHAGSSLSIAQAPREAENLAASMAIRRPHNLDKGLLNTTRLLILATGQSFSTGTAARENLTRTAITNLFMIGASVRALSAFGDTWAPQGGVVTLNPMVATSDTAGVPLNDIQIAALAHQGAWGETFLESAAQAVALAYAGLPGAPAKEWVAAAAGVGGTTIAEWQPGATPNIFKRHVDILNHFKTLNTAAGKTGSCPLVIQEIGQFDSSGGTTEGDYLQGQRDFYAALNTQIRTIMGQATDPIWVITQGGGAYVDDANLAAVQNATLTFADTTPGVFVVGPDGYVQDNRDDSNAHPTSNGHRQLGVQTGKVAVQTVVHRLDWQPLRPRRIRRVGLRKIFIDVLAPEPPLQVRPFFYGYEERILTDKGFKVSDTSGTVPLLSVAVTPTIVEITTDRDTTGEDDEVFVWCAGSTQNGNTNVTDSDATRARLTYEYRDDLGMDSRALDGLTPGSEALAGWVDQPYPLNNFMVSFRLACDWSL
jgi:hypothetical protein